MTPARGLVVCIGNELVADDAVGHHIHRRLCAAGLPDNIRLEYCGVGGIALLDLLTGDEELMLVVDAVQLGSPPGTVHTLPWDRLPEQQQAVSAHGIGIRDAVAVGRAIHPERMPKEVLLVGVEGVCFDRLGEPLSPEVAAALPEAVASVMRQLNEHGCIREV